jgi:hypothetical protein
MPSLNDLCVVTHSSHGNIDAWRCEVPLDKRDEVAVRVAVGIAARRLAVVPGLFSAWFDLAAGEPGPVEAVRLQRMLDYGLLVDVGKPDAQESDIRFFGLLAESVLHELLDSVDHGLGLPILIEGHDWSALDHGGDKLALYKLAAGPAFRLWESKALSSERRTTNDVVADAAEQLELRAAEYIGRFSVTASRAVDDAELANFVAQLPELWANSDPCAGVGVSVTTHQSLNTPCFAQLSARFTLPDANKAGHLTLLGPLDDFQTAVCHVLWRGAGLWNEP